MTVKAKSKDANTREYWELVVGNPAEYGFTTEQAHAMTESLALTDPKYWKKVLANPKTYGVTTEQAKYLAKEASKTLAEHIDEQNQMTPEERMEAEAGHHIGYYGEGHVKMWLEMGGISTKDAALLFYGENPSTFKGYDLGGPFNDMKILFDDVARDGVVRNLRDWIAVAREKSLQAVCIDGWEVCATVCTQYQPRKVASITVSSASSNVKAVTTTGDKRTPETLQFELGVHDAMTAVWNDWKVNKARDSTLTEPTKGEMYSAALNKLNDGGIKGKRKKPNISMVRDGAKSWNKPASMKVQISPALAPKKRPVFKGEI